MPRVKRTYNLRPETVLMVKDMAGRVAPTQDAVVDRSVRELARSERDRRDTAQWAAAAADPKLQRELDALWAAFDAEDRAAWDVTQ